MGSDKKKLCHLLGAPSWSQEISFSLKQRKLLWSYGGVLNLFTTWLMLTLRKMKTLSLIFQKNQRNSLNSFVPLEEPELGTTNFELPHTCMHSPTMFQFSSKITRCSSNSLARVLRKTVMMQKEFFFKSQINGMQLTMRCSWRCNSKPSITVKGKRENITNKTMNTGIVELLNHVKKECILGMVQVQVILKVKHLL